MYHPFEYAHAVADAGVAVSRSHIAVDLEHRVNMTIVSNSERVSLHIMTPCNCDRIDTRLNVAHIARHQHDECHIHDTAFIAP